MTQSPPASLSPGGKLPPILIALVVLLGLVSAALVFRDNLDAYGTPLTEDGFYSLAVARNIARGVGMTIDGVNPTNGFQPLFTFIEAGCYWLAGGHGVAAVRLIMALSCIIYLATGLIIGAIAARIGPPALASERRWIATVLYVGGFLTFMHHFNGLETGLVVLIYALAWFLYQAGYLQRHYGPPLFGVVFGLLVLTRIDAAIFVAVFVFWHFVKTVRRNPVGALITAMSIGLVALAISSPWWIYNYTTFGSLMPTSGTAQQAFAIDERRWRWIFWAFGATGLPTLWLGRFDEIFHNGILLSLLRGVVGIALIAGFVRAYQQRRPTGDAVWSRSVEFAAILAVALALLALYYGLTFIAFWFYYRYLFPTALLSCVGIAWLIAPWAARKAVPAALIAVLLTAPTLASGVMAQRGKTLHVETVYWEQLALIETEVPRDDVVAAGQAGTLGYFRPRVVNVDGKVNRDVIPFQASMWEYLAANNINWFCDWPFYVEKYLGPDPTEHGWRMVDHRGIWQLWHRTAGLDAPEGSAEKP